MSKVEIARRKLIVRLRRQIIAIISETENAVAAIGWLDPEFADIETADHCFVTISTRVKQACDLIANFHAAESEVQA